MTLRMADAVVVASTVERDDALSLGIRPDKIIMIPHGIVFPDIPRDEAPIEGDPKILTVSRITPHRNILEIVQSMQYILQSYPDAVLYVAGDPIPSTMDLAEKMYPCRVREAAANPALKGRVKLLGGVYGDALWRLFAAANLFVYASSYDNFGFGLLEAACFGVPIVSTNVGIASDLVESGKGGVIVPAHSPQVIADGVRGALANRAQLTEMSRHLKEMARKYSIEANMDAHISLYERLLKQ
jgi:glycosyltransferase involved in cell wall biosynthesis